MTTLLVNKSAKFEYEVGETYVAGLVLTGPEVKMLRLKHGSLRGSYVKVVGNEAWLINAQIPPYPYARNEDYDPTHSRKLLLSKNELLKIQEASQTQGKTAIPLAVVTAGRHLKLQIGIARGKSARDKRETIKKRDLEREARKGW